MSEQGILPGTLPEYHGRPAVEMRTAVTGAGNRIRRAHELGERVVLVAEARCVKSGHRVTDDGLVYEEAFAVVDLFEVPGEAGGELLSAMRAEAVHADDERLGRAPLPLDAGPAAEPKPEPGPDPVVVVFSDGIRETWPTDFEAGTDRPHAGDLFQFDDPPATVIVARIETPDGDTIEADLGHVNGVDPVGDDDPDDDDPLAADNPLADDDEAWAAGVDVPLPLLPGEGEDYYDPTTSLEADPENDPMADVIRFPVEPTDRDYWVVDCEVVELERRLELVTDVDEARRLIEAERRGRGRKLKTRKGAIRAIERRIAALGDAATRQPADSNGGS